MSSLRLHMFLLFPCAALVGCPEQSVQPAGDKGSVRQDAAVADVVADHTAVDLAAQDRPGDAGAVDAAPTDGWLADRLLGDSSGTDGVVSDAQMALDHTFFDARAMDTVGSDVTAADAGIVDAGLQQGVFESQSATAFGSVWRVAHNGNTSSRNEVNVVFEFAASAYRSVLFPNWAMGACLYNSNGSFTLRTMSGTATRDMGSHVAIDSSAVALPFFIPKLGNTYERKWQNQSTWPWSGQSWYDIAAPEASPALLLAQSLYAPAIGTAIQSPAVGSTLDLNRDLDVTWHSDDADRVYLVVSDDQFSYVMCPTQDTGSFTIPSSMLVNLGAASDSYKISLMRVRASLVEQQGEVLHLLTLDEVSHWLD